MLISKQSNSKNPKKPQHQFYSFNYPIFREYSQTTATQFCRICKKKLLEKSIDNKNISSHDLVSRSLFAIFFLGFFLIYSYLNEILFKSALFCWGGENKKGLGLFPICHFIMCACIRRREQGKKRKGKQGFLIVFKFKINF